MQFIPDALAGLGAYRQFMLYKLSPSRTKAGKFDKFPVTAVAGVRQTGQDAGKIAQPGDVVDAHDHTFHMTAGEALMTANQWGEGYGVAFVFTPTDPFFFIDIDDCVEGGQWSGVAQDLMTRFAGAAIEVSQSGSGLHIIGTYTGQEPEHACKNVPLRIECYTSGRFVALTGNQIVGSDRADMTVQLGQAINFYFPPAPAGSGGTGDVEWTTSPREGSNPIPDDEKLIKKAIESTGGAASAFGNKASFKDLWTGDVDSLARAYPPDPSSNNPYDGSSADAALASHLAFWTGGDCERVERLMRQSALYREKWDKHRGYMKMTVGGMCHRQQNFYNVGAPIEVVDLETVDNEPVMREGYQLVPISQQPDFFKGCVYVAETNKVLTPNGQQLNSERFNAMFGGYSFTMDHEGDKTSKKPWEVFTESQVFTFPKVDKTCFRPELSFGQIVKAEGLRLVNTYSPVDVLIEQGDVTKFFTHLELLLPDDRDRLILLSYMAACIQHKGYKIQWAPLIQGCEGNGKTLFTRCVAYAIGKRYTHKPRADEIGEKFNAWLFNNLFIGVEDIYIPNERREIQEILKPMITGEDLAKRAMQTDQAMADVCCNFIFNSNYKDAVKKTLNDRRYCVFFTNQQNEADLKRDGMDEAYFYDLYSWLKGEGDYEGKTPGYAHIAYLLQTFPIPAEFDPTGRCQRAPTTTSTMEAVAQGLGSVEQEIIEAIEQGKPGFVSPWVSSFALDELIDRLRKGSAVPRNKRAELMKSLGYVIHPGLKGGRVNNAILQEQGKPRLFIKKGSLEEVVEGPAEIARLYCQSQGYSGPTNGY